MLTNKRLAKNGHLRYLFDLIYELVVRDLKLRYKRSMLGIAWSLINPLAQLAVFSFVFRVVMPLDIPDYTSFLFTGLLVWSWFQTSLTASADAIVGNRELVRRPGFPIAILPVVTVGTQFIQFCLALPVLLLFLVAGGHKFTPAFFALPVIIALQFVFSLGLAYLVSSIHVTFRDTQYLLGLVLMLGFYLTPVLYATDHVPARYQALYGLNPLTILISSYRAILLEEKDPAILPLLIFSLGTIALFSGGYQLFMRTSHNFAEEL